MMKVYCCKKCRRISYHARRMNMVCNACEGILFQLTISYLEYTSLNQTERERIIRKYFED